MEKQFAERVVKKPAGGVSVLPERSEVQKLTVRPRTQTTGIVNRCVLVEMFLKLFSICLRWQFTDLEDSSDSMVSSLEEKQDISKLAPGPMRKSLDSHSTSVWGSSTGKGPKSGHSVLFICTVSCLPVLLSNTETNYSWNIPETEVSGWWNPFCKHSHHVSCRSDWSWNRKHTEEQPVLPQRLQRLWRRAINANVVKQHRHRHHSSHGSAAFYSHKSIKYIINTAIIKSNRYSTQGMLCAKYLLAFNIFWV